MELKRLTRLLRARWLVIALAAVLGLGGAYFAADWWNRRIEPSYRATAALTYLGTQTTSRGGADPQLQSMLTLAIQANSEILANDGVSITADEDTSRLLFTVVAPSSEIASQQALEMRRAFNEADPNSEKPLIEARLAEILAELENLEVQTGTSIPGPAIEPDDAVLSAQIEALSRLLGDLAAQLALIPDDPDNAEARLTLQTEMERVSNQITDLQAGLSTSETIPEIDREQQLQQGALEIYAGDLVSEYQTLFLRLLGRNPTTRDDVVTVDDLTPSPRSVYLMTGLGALAGALLVIAALIMIDQARRPVWTRTDLDPSFPARVELPPRRSGRKKSNPPWYPEAPIGPRKRGVQALRAGIDGVFTGEPVTVGIVDLGAGPRQVAILTADLGAALASSGRNVLTIDANLERKSRGPEPTTNATHLGNVLEFSVQDDEELQSFIKRSLGDQTEVLPGLREVPAGRVTGDSVDALSRKQFPMLLRQARSSFDTVLVTTPPLGHPATDALTQRLDFVILITRAGRTKASALQHAERDLRARRSGLLGVVLLVGRSVRFRQTKPAPIRSARRERSNRSARHLPSSSSDRANGPGRKKEKRGAPTSSTAGGDQGPKRRGLGHTIGRKAAKSLFALSDLFRGPFPGPRMLIYHQVGARLGREMEVSVQTFRRQLDWLQKHGEVVSLRDVLARLDEPAAHRLFVLTFDDGYRDMYENAFPLLVERRLPFTLYLTTNPVETGTPLAPGGGADPLTWDQVQEMLDSGLMTLGSHTHHHVDLRDLNAEVIEEELDVSSNLIRERTGVRVRHFAYPQGYWSETAEPLIARRFQTAVLGAGPPILEDADLHQIHRVPIQLSDGMLFFRRKLKRGMRMEESVRRWRRGYKGVPTGPKNMIDR